MGRNRVVTDEHIRQAVIDLVTAGVPPVTSRVRDHLIEKIGAAGATERITSVTAEVIKSLGKMTRAPVSNPNIPEDLANLAGGLVEKVYAKAVAAVESSFNEARERLQREAEESIQAADQRVKDVAGLNAMLEARVRELSDRLAQSNESLGAISAQLENLKKEHAVMAGTLESERRMHGIEIGNAKRRILELEASLEARAKQPVINIDELVERVAQATKGKNS